MVKIFKGSLNKDIKIIDDRVEFVSGLEHCDIAIFLDFREKKQANLLSKRELAPSLKPHIQSDVKSEKLTHTTHHTKDMQKDSINEILIDKVTKDKLIQSQTITNQFVADRSNKDQPSKDKPDEYQVSKDQAFYINFNQSYFIDNHKLKRFLKDSIKKSIFTMSAVLAHLLPLRKRKIDLVIVSLGLIGDYILLRNFLLPLKHKGIKFILITHKSAINIASIDLSRDQIIGLDSSNLNALKIYKSLKQVKGIESTFAFNVMYSPSYLSDYVVHLVKSKHKIGISGDYTNISFKYRQKSKRYYTRLLSVSEEVVFEFDRNAEIFNKLYDLLALDISPQDIFHIRLDLRDVLCESFSDFKDICNIGNLKCDIKSDLNFDLHSDLESSHLKSNYIVIFIGASNKLKKYGTFDQIISYVKQKFKLNVVLMGGADDRDENLEKLDVINLVGKTSIKELINIIWHSTLIIGNETGAMHIANALKKEGIVLSNGNHVQRFIQMEKNENYVLTSIYPDDFLKNLNKNKILCNIQDYGVRGDMSKINLEVVFKNIDTILGEEMKNKDLKKTSLNNVPNLDSNQDETLNKAKNKTQENIIKMFDSIAPTYDRANRILSMGIDINWRREACQECFKILDKDRVSIADIACGTGDMILMWQGYAKEKGIRTDIVGVDPSSGMLEIAKKKLSNVTLKLGWGSSIALDDESVDIVSISYGLRNVVQREETLREFFRILRPGGLLVILEFMGNEKKSIAYKMMGFYTNKILPTLGGLISRNKEAYEYLPKSIGNFISTQTLSAELSCVGFSNIFEKDYSAGISSLLIYKRLD